MTSRGISTQAIERFRIGYTADIPDPRTGTAHRISIPYLTPAGPWLVKYRCPHRHDCKELGHGKYIYESGVELHLYNAQTLRTASRVVVTEGELDAVAVEMAGVPAVAYPGADAWSKNKHWRWCFDGCDEVVVVADGDLPKDPEKESRGVGELAALRVVDSLRTSIRADVRMVLMPTGDDSNSFIAREGDVEFLDLIGLI